MAIVSDFTDLHLWDKSLRSRRDYVRESLDLFDIVVKEVKEVRALYPNEKYVVVLCGDVFHKDSKSVTAGIQWSQRFYILRTLCDELIFVIGNHEITWSQDNVFWTLITECRGKNIPVTPNYAKGLIPIAKVMDYMDLDGVRLHFVHYHGDVSEMCDGKNIAFVHDDYLCPDLVNLIEAKNNVDLKTEYVGYKNIEESSKLSGLDAIFFSHNHKASGVYDLELISGKITRVYYLMSLGRTTKDQVFETGTKRMVPLIRISNGDFDVVRRYVELPHAKDVIDIVAVKKSEESYEKQKQNRAIRQTRISGVDPVDDIREKLKELPEAVEMFDLSKDRKRPEWLRRLLE